MALQKRKQIGKYCFYGCWCLPTGAGLIPYGEPVDNIDNSCKEYTKCYNCKSIFLLFLLYENIRKLKTSVGQPVAASRSTVVDSIMVAVSISVYLSEEKVKRWCKTLIEWVVLLSISHYKNIEKAMIVLNVGWITCRTKHAPILDAYYRSHTIWVQIFIWL